MRSVKNADNIFSCTHHHNALMRAILVFVIE